MRSFLAAAFALSLTWGLSGCDTPVEKKADTVTPPPVVTPPPADTPKDGGKMEVSAPAPAPSPEKPAPAPEKPAPAPEKPAEPK